MTTTKDVKDTYKLVWEGGTDRYHSSLGQKFRHCCARLTAQFTTQLLPVNNYRKLFIRLLLDKPIQLLLADLIKGDVIIDWSWWQFLSDKPAITVCKLQPKIPVTPSGKEARLQGAISGGVGYTLNQAIRPALGELFERRALCIWETDRFKTGSFKTLAALGAVNPSSVLTFSEKQLQQKEFQRSLISEEKSMQWIEAKTLDTESVALIPAQLVYLNYEFEYLQEPIFRQTTSNGAAAGTSYNRAVYGAICEVIERDAFLLFWLNRLTPPRVRLDSLPSDRLQKLLLDIKNKGFELNILHLTTDIKINVFVGVLINRNYGRAVSISAACDLNPLLAIEKTVLELAKFPFFAIPNHRTWKELSQYKNIRTFKDRAVFWSDRRMIDKIEFFSSGEEINFNTLPGTEANQIVSAAYELKYLQKQLKLNGHKCYVVDITTTEAKRVGLWVVKAILPGLIPYYYNELYKPLGVSRLYTLPPTLGLRNAQLNEQTLNLKPHPFL